MRTPAACHAQIESSRHRASCCGFFEPRRARMDLATRDRARACASRPGGSPLPWRLARGTRARLAPAHSSRVCSARTAQQEAIVAPQRAQPAARRPLAEGQLLELELGRQRGHALDERVARLLLRLLCLDALALRYRTARVALRPRAAAAADTVAVAAAAVAVAAAIFSGPPGRPPTPPSGCACSPPPPTRACRRGRPRRRQPRPPTVARSARCPARAPPGRWCRHRPRPHPTGRGRSGAPAAAPSRAGSAADTRGVASGPRSAFFAPTGAGCRLRQCRRPAPAALRQSATSTRAARWPPRGQALRRRRPPKLMDRC
eukprot:5015812-Prymnesium_polylepis.1